MLKHEDLKNGKQVIGKDKIKSELECDAAGPCVEGTRV